MKIRRSERWLGCICVFALATGLLPGFANAQTKKPNILVIMGDDIGWYNLRSDPFERGPQSFLYSDWLAHRAFIIVPTQAVVGKWLESFKEYPIRQKPASFNLDDLIRKLTPSN